MRVLVTADTVGGVWTYTRELVLGLVRNGIEVVVVSFGQIPTPAEARWLSGLRGVTYIPTAFRLEWMQEAEQDIRESRDYLMGVVDEFQPDILHLNQYCYGNLPIATPRIIVAHSDVVSWWREVHGDEPPPDGWTSWYRRTVEDGLRSASAVVAPSRWMLEAIDDIYHPSCVKSVIYNGRTPSLFNAHAQKQDLAVSVGRLWDPAKNVSMIARAAISGKVLIAGASTSPDDDSSAVNFLAENPTVEVQGLKTEPQLRELYSRAAIYIASSQYEPFGLAPLEAAFSRCAIVANDIPSLREIWGDTACYFRRNDVGAMAEVVERLMNDSSVRAMYAVLAYTRARMRYSANRMVSEYIALYDSLTTAGAMAA
jgi:glycosyltransferase involved in cell wall biosynthesis